MAAAQPASSGGPRYAPEDPTLPKPWRGLVDGSTGYIYFWNPETNVTQYERPASTPLPGPPPLPIPKSASVSVSSSVQIQQSLGSASHGHKQHHSNEDDSRYHGGSKSGPKLASIPGERSHLGTRSSSHSQNVPNGSANAGHGSAGVHNHAPGAQTLRSSARGHGSSDMGGGLSVESYRRQHEISASGNDVPAPFMTFDSTGFPSEILREVHHAGFSAPTPIQAQSWPIALQGRDIVAIAKTGSGKTLGYLIPGFIHLKRCRNNSKAGPTVLVLSPTRELATQIQEEAVKFGRSSRISCTCLYGGAPKGPQLRDIERGADVVVATPGRLNDILEMRRVSLRQVSYLVLDEADRMLDMGFEPQIRKIVKEIPARRQTLMYTATWPKEVRKIAADLLVNPVQVNIGSIDELVANKAITQFVEVTTPMEKQRRLEQILRSQEPGSKVIIFCSTKRMCDQLARSITRQFGAAAIHGDKSQGERDWVLNQFRTGKSPILVATDVAARGLDIKDIRVVINYDFPTGIEDYVHRIGRTGRAGATGVAYTFFCDQDAKYARDLIKVLEGAGQRVPSEVRDMAIRGGGGRHRSRWGSGSNGRDRSRGGRDDSNHGGRGGRGPPPSSGRPERGRGGRGRDDREPRDRYRDGHDMDVRGRPDRGFPADNIDRRVGERGRGRSLSPAAKKGQVWSGGHGHSRSRSRSFDRHVGARPVRKRSPLPKRNDGSPTVNKLVDRSPPPHEQQWGSPYENEDAGEFVEPARSPHSPQRERSRSPDSGREQSRSPYNGRERESEDDGLGQQQWELSPQNGEEEEAGEFAEKPTWHQQHRSSSPYLVEEEEEGMIPADEEGMIPEDEDGGNSPSARSDPPN
ncbi:DEAD-box ATP-dependent RNA helicase 14-like isoform X2 [Magnolia sinica]|uniref:DEAD-box ATP-dependent RNA helicase 14-like isoform X2 n=1 Tax=Magnolia sinica TaxID=86752 RepID=UPI00265879A1|nr:DEAD-box ATP-dependent RNA helicase 14-like isoform X2 [Magnolia sinica]